MRNKIKNKKVFLLERNKKNEKINREKGKKMGYDRSHMGSWIGGRMGLMLYDVANGVHFLLHSVQSLGSEVQKTSADYQ